MLFSAGSCALLSLSICFFIEYSPFLSQDSRLLVIIGVRRVHCFNEKIFFKLFDYLYLLSA